MDHTNDYWIWDIIFMMAFALAAFTYHLVQIFRNNLPPKIYRWSISYFILLIFKLVMDIVRRMNKQRLDNTNCFLLGKILTTTQGLSQIALGQVLFAIAFIVLGDLVHWLRRMKLAYLAFLASATITLALNCAFTNYDTRNSEEFCTIRKTDTLTAAFLTACFHTVLTVFLFATIFIVPLWVSWSQDDPKRKRVLKKSLMWVGVYGGCVTVGLGVYMLKFATGWMACSIIYVGEMLCLVNQFKVPRLTMKKRESFWEEIGQTIQNPKCVTHTSGKILPLSVKNSE